MGSTWRRAKQGLCAFIPSTQFDNSDDDDDGCADSSPPSAASPSPGRHSSAALLFPPASSASLSISSSISSSKKTCAICLASMKRGDGQAIFIAECSHSFHFKCISSNVKHGNQICPICRAKWKNIPLQFPNLDPPPGRVRVNPMNWPQNQPPEPSLFDDDESLGQQLINPTENEVNRTIEIKIHPEFPSFPRFDSSSQFTALVNLKAPPSITQSPRAGIDLVTVLDISGSMAGTKLALLKRAMGFVIQNLGPNDRLAVIAFSSTGSRLFPLRRMCGRGRQTALEGVNSLVANGWTNIGEGLRMGAKIMDDRREKNPVASIMLLSDGQDTPTLNNSTSSFKIPVHTFGFGADHDASLMHKISEVSRGTFSFIETESVIQDAFAQCIAGLLSVVVKELRLSIECIHPGVRVVGSLRAGSFPNHLMPDGQMGLIDVGDIYADEERDFLVSTNLPSEVSGNETSLLKVRCVYNDPLTKQSVEVGSGELRIKRPEVEERVIMSIEVDRHRNRLQAAEAMAQARGLAERGDLVGASSVLENCRKALGESVSAKSHDRLCISLDAELKEMQERMASRHVYEVSGRAYILSGLSSHSWQRATTRGDSTDESSLIWAYQTPSMVEMVTHSQAALFGSPQLRGSLGQFRPWARNQSLGNTVWGS